MKKVEIKSKQLVFDGFFKIEEAELRYERFDGTMSETVKRLNLDRGDSVAVLILNLDTQNVILTNQFKYPTYANGDGWIIEVVAGMVNAGEDHEAAVRREVLEETGYKVAGLTHVSTFYVSPGGTSERIILYYAEVRNVDRVASGGGVAAEAEDIELVELPLVDVPQKLESNFIADAKTIVALMWLVHRKD
jgi:ADP-ribose pyrophosphatase